MTAKMIYVLYFTDAKATGVIITTMKLNACVFLASMQETNRIGKL